jgi:hypothetical protein
MKKVLLMAALLSAVAVQATVERIPPQPGKQPWKSGETIVTLSLDGTLRISGNGAMEDYPFERGGWSYTPWSSAIWHDAAPPVISVIIEEGVTHIGANAFRGDISTIQSITVAADNAHYSSEAGILFNKDKTALIFYPNKGQFYNYTIPNGVTSIGDEVFRSHISLTSITIPNSVASIGESAFKNCISLTSITIPNSVASIEDHTFAYCESLTSVVIPDGVKSIGEGAFSDCRNLTSVTIGNGVKSIGAAAFYDCRSLTSVKIGDSVTTIGEFAFVNCDGLTSVTIPKSVASIGKKAFAGSTNLTTITVLNPRPPELGSEVFFDTGCYIIYVPAYVPARSYFAYRAADGWKEFKPVKVFFTIYEVIALGILSALLLSAVVFVIVKKSRSR